MKYDFYKQTKNQNLSLLSVCLSVYVILGETH